MSHHYPPTTIFGRILASLFTRPSNEDLINHGQAFVCKNFWIDLLFVERIPSLFGTPSTRDIVKSKFLQTKDHRKISSNKRLTHILRFHTDSFETIFESFETIFESTESIFESTETIFESVEIIFSYDIKLTLIQHEMLSIHRFFHSHFTRGRCYGFRCRYPQPFCPIWRIRFGVKSSGSGGCNVRSLSIGRCGVRSLSIGRCGVRSLRIGR